MIEYTVKVFPDRTEWYLGDKLHREDGPAYENSDGYKVWYLNDNRHREDGPAVEWANGDKFWYLNDIRHRVDGPAVECANGHKLWYLHGKQYSEKDFIAKTQAVRELSIADLEALLGHKIKIVK